MPPQISPSQDQASDIAKILQDPTLGTSKNVGRTPGGMVNTLTGQMLAPVPSVDYKNPSPTPPESISDLSISNPPKASLTERETQVDALTQRVMDINNSLMGKSAFTQEKRGEFGMPDKEQAIQDLTRQFNDLQKKEAVINTEYGGSLAANRGVLEPFVTGEKDARLRQNAVQALTISSTIDAANGLLASAQRKVDLAVQQKYGAIEEELKIKKENLEIFSKSPGLSRDEKDRAAAQTFALKNQELKVEQKKQEQKDIWNLSTTASQNIQSFRPTEEFKTAAQAIQTGQNAKTKEEALRIFTSTGLTKQPTQQSDFEQAFFRDKGRLPTVQELSDFQKGAKTEPGDIQTFRAFFPNVDIKTSAGQQQYLNWKAKEAAANRQAPTGETRDTIVSQYLQNKKGNDGFVLAQSYQEGLRKFIASGGTQTNFLASFPQQTYLRQEEIDKLPAALRTIQVASQKTLSADQQSIINEAKATWDAAKQTYQATPELRQKIIDRAKTLNFDLSPYF